MLACARIGAVHSVVFGGFSSDALASRIEDCKARVLITCNGELGACAGLNCLLDPCMYCLAHAPSAAGQAPLSAAGWCPSPRRLADPTCLPAPPHLPRLQPSSAAPRRLT